MLSWNESSETNHELFSNYQIIRRNGAVVPFEPNKIATAMVTAFLAVHSPVRRTVGAGFLSAIPPNLLSHATAVHKRWILATASLTKEHLFALSKLAVTTIKLHSGGASRFFCGTKANLRNAP